MGKSHRSWQKKHRACMQYPWNDTCSSAQKSSAFSPFVPRKKSGRSRRRASQKARQQVLEKVFLKQQEQQKEFDSEQQMSSSIASPIASEEVSINEVTLLRQQYDGATSVEKELYAVEATRTRCFPRSSSNVMQLCQKMTEKHETVGINLPTSDIAGDASTSEVAPLSQQASDIDEQKTIHYSQLAHDAHTEKVVVFHQQDDLKMMRQRIFEQYRQQVRTPAEIGFLTRNTATIDKTSLIGELALSDQLDHQLTAAILVDVDDRIFIHVTDEKPLLHQINIPKHTSLLGIELANVGGRYPVVIAIQPDSYASRCSLQVGDLIVRAQGLSAEGKSAAWTGKQLKNAPIGQSVKLDVFKVRRATKTYEWKKIAGVWTRGDLVNPSDEIIDPMDAAC